MIEQYNNITNVNWSLPSRGYDPGIGRFTGVDPKADNYSSLSTYNYVKNNPLIYIDPNGKEIIVNGQKWTPGATYEGDDNFGKQVFAALNKIASSKHEKSRQMVENLAETEEVSIDIVKSSSTQSNVILGKYKGERKMIKNQIIKFNPNLGLEDIETGESFSPDVSLLHELGHMANAKEDPDKFHDRKFTPNEKWKDEEEKYNIEKWEQPYAESRDMMQRTKGYEKGYKTIRTVNSTSNKNENE